MKITEILLLAGSALVPFTNAGAAVADGAHWVVNNSSGAGTISYNGWELKFKGLRSGGGIVIDYGAISYGADGILDFSLPMYDESGNSYYVRAIATKAFRPTENPGVDVTKIKEVRLGNQVSTIEVQAFSGCTNLKVVEPFIPDSVTSLGKQAFYNCPITSKLTVRNVEKLNERVFYSTAFGEAELPSVTNIDYQAFMGNGTLSNVVFSTQSVAFASLTTPANGYGNGCFGSASTSAKFYFPGKAPLLPANGTDAAGQACAGTLYLFGSGKGSRSIYGSWKLDPEGWNKILSEVGKPVSEIVDSLPTLQKGERRVKGMVFYWQNASTHEKNSAWLIDWKSPLEPKHGIVVVVK